MNNIILEMKQIVEESKKDNLSFEQVRNRLKEYLHYFVLDSIYNSQFKNMVFYGGSSLRVVYDLDRMSIDLDFEALTDLNIGELKKSLEKYFNSDIGLKGKFSIKGEKKNEFVNRIFLNFSLMNEIGLSPNKDEVLRVRIDIMLVSRSYLKKAKPIFTLKSKHGKSFVVKHYDLDTLFASKLMAVLDRPKKGFAVGGDKEGVNFKGRDYYDLIWYMEKGASPNKTMLTLKGYKGSSGDLFDEIALFISKNRLEKGIKKDLEPLLFNSADTFASNFEGMFHRLSKKYNKQ